MFSKEQKDFCEIDFASLFLSFFDNGYIHGDEYQYFKDAIDTDIIEMNFTSSFEKQVEESKTLENQSNSITNLPVLSDELITNTQFLLLTKEVVKRGRRPTKINKDFTVTTKEPLHTKESIDNIRRKIKTHFIQFLICFMNEVIAVKLQTKPKLEFKPIDYKVIKNITQSVNRKQFQMKLRDFLNLPLSARVKFNRNQNVYIITNLTHANIECINELLEMTLNDFYDAIYLGKPENIKSKYGLNESRTKKQFDTKNQLNFFEEDLDSIDKKEERYYYLTKEIGMTLTKFFSNSLIKLPID